MSARDSIPEDRLPDLTIKAPPGGNFELSQCFGVEDPAVVELHPAHVRILAEHAGLLSAPPPDPAPRLSAAHVRRLLALDHRLAELRDSYLDEILERCGSGVEISLHLRALADLLGELLGDLPPEPREVRPDAPAHGRSALGVLPCEDVA
jgi:hypothetical protein